MAKQNVSFIERHVEKFVAGAGSVVLLLVAATYLISTPHKVAVNGQSLDPGDFYSYIATQADAARARMQKASTEEARARLPNLDAIVMPNVDPPPLRLSVAPVPPNPAVAEITGVIPGPPGRKAELAAILPPTRPVLTTSRSPGRLPPTRLISVSSLELTSGSGNSEDLMPLATADWHWVTAAFVVSKKAQRAAFAEAGYLPERLDLIVAEVRAERQERLPNGQWSERRLVEPYVPERFRDWPTIELVTQENGYAVTPDGAREIQARRARLDDPKAQEDILRPPFQQYLGAIGDAGRAHQEWKLPEPLKAPDGTPIDPTAPEFRTGLGSERGSTLPRARGLPESPAGTRAPAGPGGAAGGADKKNINVWIKETYDQADQALAAEDYLEAKRLWEQIDADASVPAFRKRDAQRFLAQYKSQFEQAELEQQMAARKQASGTGTSTLEREFEPAWINDTDVEPGKTYRYRISLLALNQYAGMANYLQNFQDAGKLVVQGRWSEWSDPITVRPDKYLIVTSIRENTHTARLEMYQWSAGRWEKAVSELGIGDPVSFERRAEPALSYDAVIVAMEFGRPYPQRSDRKKLYEPAVTEALILVNAKGQAEERLVAEDGARRRDVVAVIKDEEKAYEEKAPGGARP